MSGTIITEYSLHRVLGSDEFGPNGGTELLCPDCLPETVGGFADSCAYVHFESPIEHITDDYSCPTGERGAWIDVPCWCENDHRFHLVIAFHKGNSFVHVVAGEAADSFATAPLSPR
jgi:hypothetical protein